MLKHQYVINLGLATLLGVPAVSLSGGQEPVGLEERLTQTIRALEQLAGLSQRIENGDPAAMGTILAATEGPILEPQERDEFLSQLRAEVSGLRMTFDALTASDPSFPGQANTGPGISAPDSGELAPSPDGGIATTGLDDAARRALTEVRPHLTQISPEVRQHEVRQAFETDPAYSADVVRQGRLLVRAQRYLEALQILTPHSESSEARYWIARCYEKLDRVPEAIELLQALSDDDQAGAYKRRAAIDLGFLKVKRELSQRRRVAGEPK